MSLHNKVQLTREETHETNDTAFKQHKWIADCMLYTSYSAWNTIIISWSWVEGKYTGHELHLQTLIVNAKYEYTIFISG